MGGTRWLLLLRQIGWPTSGFSHFWVAEEPTRTAFLAGGRGLLEQISQSPTPWDDFV
jgi:hypothetical protein